jgi:Ca2+-binding EF-hand superfamily protein
MSEMDSETKRRASLTEGLPVIKLKHKQHLQQIAEEAEEELIDDASAVRSQMLVVTKTLKQPIFPKIATASPADKPSQASVSASSVVAKPVKSHATRQSPAVKRRSKSLNLSFRMLKSVPGVTNHLITGADRAAFLRKKHRVIGQPDTYGVGSPSLSHRPNLPSLKPQAELRGLHPGLQKFNSGTKAKIKAIASMRPQKREGLSSSSSSTRELDSSDAESSNAGRSQVQSRTMSRLRRGRMKSKFASNLDKNNESLIQIFKLICKYTDRGSKKVSSSGFKTYLAARYPESFIETISKYFNFGDGVILEAYIGEFEKFLSQSDDRLLHFVFDVFDSNRDHYLCYADTFIMISQIKEDCYNRDLSKLKQMFALKKSRNAPGRKTKGERRTSIYNSLHEDEDSRARRKKFPYISSSRPEALTFEDFARVEFGGKPQFFGDFLKYCCAILPQEATTLSTSLISRQNTEDFLAEASLSLSAFSMLAKDERASYFKELVRPTQSDIISNFTHAESQVLMAKFKILKASGTARKMLSRDSVLSNFVRSS